MSRDVAVSVGAERQAQKRSGTAYLDVEVALDEFAELAAVFVFHVHELDAIAFGVDIAHDGGEMDFAQAGTNFELDGVADAEFGEGLEISASEVGGSNAS